MWVAFAVILVDVTHAADAKYVSGPDHNGNNLARYSEDIANNGPDHIGSD